MAVSIGAGVGEVVKFDRFDFAKVVWLVAARYLELGEASKLFSPLYPLYLQVVGYQIIPNVSHLGK